MPGKLPATYTLVEPDAAVAEQYSQMRTAAEWIFGMENGAVARDANTIELEQLYNGFVKRLINSYDKLKTKFNTYAAKCLSERQKRECGLALVAPALILPHEKAAMPEGGAENTQLYGGNPSAALQQNMSPRSML